MREDMHKVIVERGRSHWRGKGDRRPFQRIEVEEWPSREGMRRRPNGAPGWSNQPTGALGRFLGRRVGRRWDEVFSELCAGVSGRRASIRRQHLLDHLSGLVEERVLIVCGWPCRSDGYAFGEPLSRATWGRPFYLCPATGLLLRRPDCPPSAAIRATIRKELARLGR